MSSTVEVKVSGRVAEVCVNRPDALNALNTDVLGGLSAAFQELSARLSEIVLVLLRGSGGKAFVAGADIKLMSSGDPAQLSAFTALGQRVMNEIQAFPLPVVAVVDGFALGGGLELALSADLIVVTEKAKLGQPEVNLGLIPGFGGTQRLQLRVGSGAAKRLIYSGETINGEEAFRIGLAEYCFKSDELAVKLDKLVNELSSRPASALIAGKKAIAAQSAAALREGLKNEEALFMKQMLTADAREGMSAFLEKRSPNFPAKS